MLVCGGGTGGHVYPALAVIEALRVAGADANPVLYVGAPGSAEERLSAREGLPFAPVASGQMRGRNPLIVARSLARASRGVGQARRIIASFRPDVVFSTGGYASAPVLIAARWAGCPALVFLPDIEPGITIKLLSRLTQRVAVSFDDAARYFPAGKVVVTGYPVRRAVRDMTRAAGRSALGLPPDGLIVLAFGGSQGARSINRAVAGAASRWAALAHIIHITGERDYDWAMQQRAGLPAEVQSRYHVFAYLHNEMPAALAAADLAVARAGASTLGEFPAAGLPSILVPYPYSGQHQYANARFMQRVGAALLLEDSALSSQLAGAVEALLTDAGRRQAMASATRALARPTAAEALAAELRRLARN
jgi:UDP-N-acetylglucosamine--N-acetylmuramyl-(pentapeptide) pyrophosphoryl-undecaprenol N-acetylglucosamine transferase